MYNVDTVINKISCIENLWEINGTSNGAYQKELNNSFNELISIVGKKTAMEIVPQYVFHEYY